MVLSHWQMIRRGPSQNLYGRVTAMGGYLDKGYDTSADIRVPTITREMWTHAVMVICGMAWNVDDARFLLDTLGIPDDVLMEARSDDDGHELGVV